MADYATIGVLAQSETFTFFLQRYVRFALWEKDRWTKEALQVSALL